MTDGYTSGKKMAHVASVLLIAIVGIALIAVAYSNVPRLRMWVMIIGGVLIFIGLGALIPIVSKEAVDSS